MLKTPKLKGLITPLHVNNDITYHNSQLKILWFNTVMSSYGLSRHSNEKLNRMILTIHLSKSNKKALYIIIRVKTYLNKMIREKCFGDNFIVVF